MYLGTTTGFLEAFGPERIKGHLQFRKRVLWEQLAGASMVGMRPIVDLTIASFVYPSDGPGLQYYREVAFIYMVGRQSYP